MKPMTLIACIAVGGAVAIPVGILITDKSRPLLAALNERVHAPGVRSAMLRMVDGKQVLSINCGSTTYVDVAQDYPGFSESALDLIRDGCSTNPDSKFPVSRVGAIAVSDPKGNRVQSWP